MYIVKICFESSVCLANGRCPNSYLMSQGNEAVNKRDKVAITRNYDKFLPFRAKESPFIRMHSNLSIHCLFHTSLTGRVMGNINRTESEPIQQFVSVGFSRL